MKPGKLTLFTRPFQPLFLASVDLLQRAKPYFEQIQAHRNRGIAGSGASQLRADVWRLEKSMCIGSFMTMYAGLEALVNCVFADHGARDVPALPIEYFVDVLAKNRSKIVKKEFLTLHLGTRVYLLPALCSNPQVDPRGVFDIFSMEWKKFMEVIEIRHWLTHARGEKIELVVRRGGPTGWIADDRNPANFWPLTQTSRDHRIFNYKTTLELKAILDWVVARLRHALPDQLDNEYMGKEQGKTS